MKIVVCVKQVPASNDAKIDPVTKRIVREGIKSIMNPFDLYALEEGIRLKEKFGGQVIALSMGPPKAEAVLRSPVCRGRPRHTSKRQGIRRLRYMGHQLCTGQGHRKNRPCGPGDLRQAGHRWRYCPGRAGHCRPSGLDAGCRCHGSSGERFQHHSKADA